MTNPDTLRMVPVEPTPEMMAAGADTLQIGMDNAADIYRAMLEAAPASPLGEGWRPSLESIARAVDQKAWAFYDKWIADPAMIAECEFEVAASKRIAETILALPAAPIGAK